MARQVLAEIKRIAKGIEILSPDAFSFGGRAFAHAASQPQAPGVAAGDDPLLGSMAHWIYLYCFCHRFDGALPDDTAPPRDDNGLTSKLSQANQSTERWDRGWFIVQVLNSGQVVAQKSGHNRTVWPGQYINHDGLATPPRVGASISLFVQKESRSFQPGFYMAFGDAMSEEPDDNRLVRFYWNISAAGITELMALVTGSLNRFVVPFRFKCLTYPASYTRIDSAVLYCNRRFYKITAELMAGVHAKIRPFLSPETPLFTRQLAPGLGLAEDPGQPDSFGTHRCRMIARGIVNAHNQNARTDQARLDEVVKQFEQQGIDLERPYLNPGSTDIYAFPARQG